MWMLRGMMQAEDGVALKQNCLSYNNYQNSTVHVVFVFFTCALGTVTSCHVKHQP